MNQRTPWNQTAATTPTSSRSNNAARSRIQNPARGAVWASTVPEPAGTATPKPTSPGAPLGPGGIGLVAAAAGRGLDWNIVSTTAPKPSGAAAHHANNPTTGIT